MKTKRIDELMNLYKTSLLEDVMPFWERHGVDHEAGGFFTFLERDGSVYGTDKPVWLMGRATWTFATLHRLVEPRPEWLQLARSGCDFLTRHCFAPNGKMYFSVTREGNPLRMRRYVFSELFAALAMSATAAITGDDNLKRRSIELFDVFVKYQTEPGLIEPKIDPQTRPTKSLAPLMCLLNVADSMLLIDQDARYERIIDEAIEELFRYFVKEDIGAVLETVGPRGEVLDTTDGRCLNPGHAIEAAWFVMEIARRRSDAELTQRALRILDLSFERGWDCEHGGLRYFADLRGKPSIYLEHDMKLWWGHCEALYASLLAHHLTGDAKYAQMYEQIHEWSFSHFPDPEHGEWYGYLHYDGTPSTTLKGGTWKGPFHVPRTLLFCWKLLEDMRGT